MRRTQIYLEEELDCRLRATAAAQGKSAAHLIRSALRAYLQGTSQPRGKDPFLDIAGTMRGGPKDAAASHDRYLYGAHPRRRKKARP